MSLVKPMKAPSKSVHMLIPDGNLDRLTFPLYASYKLDGVRATVQDCKVYSNTLKLIPNQYVQKVLGRGGYEGFDGELIVGPPNAPDVFRRTMSGVMSRDGEPDVCLYCFDIVKDLATFIGRYETLVRRVTTLNRHSNEGLFVQLLPEVLIRNTKELLDYERVALELGYEGLMLRNVYGSYKEGPNRTTLKSGELLKLKRFEDSEAMVVEILEASTNTNKAEINELGRSKRSSHKAGKVANGMLGAIIGRDIHTQQLVKVGPGTLTKNQRIEWWEHRNEKLGEIFVYKFFPTGGKELPRFPTYKGLRAQIDITKK